MKTLDAKTPLILALECAAGRATAALAQNGKIITQTETIAQHGHAASIIPLTKDALENAGHQFNQITHILAGRGPGSFTGIRVALAAAKGIALALEINAYGLSSLEAMASFVRKSPHAKDRHIISMIDSRRKSIFFQAFAPDGQPPDGQSPDGQSPDGQSLADIRNGTQNDIAELIKNHEKSSPEKSWIIAGFEAHEIAHLCPSQDVLVIEHPDPEAADLIMLFEEMTKKSQTLAHDQLEPIYLTPPLLGPQ